MILFISSSDQKEIFYLGKVSFKIVCHSAKGIRIPLGGLTKCSYRFQSWRFNNFLCCTLKGTELSWEEAMVCQTH